jgi:hypothetical protein
VVATQLAEIVRDAVWFWEDVIRRLPTLTRRERRLTRSKK